MMAKSKKPKPQKLPTMPSPDSEGDNLTDMVKKILENQENIERKLDDLADRLDEVGRLG